MFTLAILIGIYSYAIFFIGLLGLLYWPIIVIVTLLFIGGNIYYFRKTISLEKVQFSKVQHYVVHNKLFLIFLLFIVLQALVNLVGVLGPELGFDALWYHLMLPKLYLNSHSIFHIPGGLFYYSDMPKLVELLYTGLLAFRIDFLPKFLHFLFGLATVYTLYRFSRKWIGSLLSVLVCAIFYSNLVVGWESITAYVDLGRTFFELLAVVAFFEWFETKQRKWFYYSAITVGLAMATKTIAFSSLAIFLVMIFTVNRKQNKNWLLIGKSLLLFMGIAILIPLPWFLFSFIHTGNPFYPIFDPIYGSSGFVGWQLLNPVYFINTLWTLFIHAADPISPWYIMLLPLVINFYKKSDVKFRLLCLYSLLVLFFWYLTPNTGGGRFILPYLPLVSLVSVYSLQFLKSKQRNYLMILAGLLICISLVYRGVANAKFTPVLQGRESQPYFLQIT